MAFLGKGIVKQISSAVLNPFKFAFGGLQTDLDRLSSVVQTEVTLASHKDQRLEAAENSKLRALVSKLSEAHTKEWEEKRRRRERKAKVKFLNACSTYNHMTAWRQARKQGNASWIMSNESYLKWKENGGALWCSGIVGSGKSVLSANVVDDIRLSAADNVVACFFCRHDEVDSLKYTTILRSVARQLLESAPACFEDWQGHSLDIDEIIDQLERVPHSFAKSAYIIIDGLDECANEDRDLVLTSLRDLNGHMGGQFHIYCSSRPDLSRQGFLVLQPQWNVSMTETNSEVAAYISNIVADCQGSGLLHVGGSAILETICSSLLKNADGM